MRPSRPVVLAAFAVGSAALLAAGCSGGKLYPVTGKVLVNGQPAGGAVVVFNPAANPATMDRKPTGFAKADGTFVVGTFKDDDGAAPGEYLVTLAWPGQPPAAKAAGPKGLGGGDERALDGSDQLKGKYRDPQTSGIKVTIQAGPNDLPPFDLKN
ncbi:MAG TPA: hypothetical protein VH092_26865 [Urbifossiella sp.]|nr:hypothetical protein [Urbifossiella sp.]